MIQAISAREAGDSKTQGGQGYELNIKMKNFDPPKDFKVNLFKDTAFFDSYEILYSELVKVNAFA